MNDFFNNLKRIALKKKSKIILPEINDSRIIQAKEELTKLGFIIHNIDDYNENYSNLFKYIKKKKFTKNWPETEIKKYLDLPLNKSLALLGCGYIDAVVAGAVNSTSDILRSSLRIVGITDQSKWLSSFFLMCSKDYKTKLSFADCAVIPEPTPHQLVSIAENTAKMHELITQEEPKVAFLSFSTNGSASHYRVDKVKEATEIFIKKNPHIICEGEVQFDAAISPNIALKKNSKSNLKGQANVLIFPNLDAGNISYKITRELAGYHACGPLLMGLNKPVHDLSRSCSVNDIINVTIIAAIQKSS
tara:strand:- start:2601 stop:3512 length:912 start_codon:yes stop_codon:yes gene_type:complete